MKLRQKNKNKTTGVTLLICHDQQTMRDLTFWLPLQQIKHAKWTNSCGRVNSCQQCWLDASQNLWSILNHISLTMAWKPLLWLVIGLCDMMTCDDSKLFFFLPWRKSLYDNIFPYLMTPSILRYDTYTDAGHLHEGKTNKCGERETQRGNSGQKKGLWTRRASSVIWLGCDGLTWTRKPVPRTDSNTIKLVHYMCKNNIKSVWECPQMKDTKIQWSAQNKLPLRWCCFFCKSQLNTVFTLNLQKGFKIKMGKNNQIWLSISYVTGTDFKMYLM